MTGAHVDWRTTCSTLSAADTTRALPTSGASVTSSAFIVSGVMPTWSARMMWA